MDERLSKSFIRAVAFSANAESPTESHSSIKIISALVLVETAKPKRIDIPEEYVRIGIYR